MDSSRGVASNDYEELEKDGPLEALTAPEGFDLEVRADLHERRMRVHDLDNPLKDIFDALQGRLGGPKGGPRKQHLIGNDNQIQRVSMEKRLVPDNQAPQIHIVIRSHDVEDYPAVQ